MLVLSSCVTVSIPNPQNWDDDIAMQREFQRMTKNRSYSYQGDTLTITAIN